MKKHAITMTKEEIKTIRAVIKLSTDWQSVGKIERKPARLSSIDIFRLPTIIKSGRWRVVEFNHNTSDSIRVLVRGHYQKGKDICIVLSLIDRKIITAWLNDREDNHATCDMSQYRLTEDISNILKTMNERGKHASQGYYR